MPLKCTMLSQRLCNNCFLFLTGFSYFITYFPETEKSWLLAMAKCQCAAMQGLLHRVLQQPLRVPNQILARPISTLLRQFVTKDFLLSRLATPTWVLQCTLGHFCPRSVGERETCQCIQVWTLIVRSGLDFQHTNPRRTRQTLLR